ncbi:MULTISPECIES: tetratricopeptide repeat protein [unclassified Lentimicrobium]|uniref:tetratricopeptide repeat protein n=1 Tax=unclassified Lentimicrobium TaxID=2677434 RepID=UPI001553DD25|nr:MULTISPECIES: hypothetical protein [unclassified Lentimicrobium]NPD46391.1 hypothetical protein [Lentimicrobium sp. S6]NPD83577.1 hypothetical protein [Lentimicrobium sp. L6]
MKSLVIIFLLIFSIYSCQKTDDAITVVQKFHSFKKGTDLSKEYNLLSYESKFYTSLDIYKTVYSNRAELLDTADVFIIGTTREIDLDHPHKNFKLFETEATTILKNSNDTIRNYYYCTTKKEDNTWKIVWLIYVNQIANSYKNEGDYQEALNWYYEMVRLDPYCYYAYFQLSHYYFNRGDYQSAKSYNDTAFIFSPKWNTKEHIRYNKVLEDSISNKRNNSCK